MLNARNVPSQIYILYKTRIRLQIEIGMGFDQ